MDRYQQWLQEHQRYPAFLSNHWCAVLSYKMETLTEPRTLTIPYFVAEEELAKEEKNRQLSRVIKYWVIELLKSHNEATNVDNYEEVLRVYLEGVMPLNVAPPLSPADSFHFLPAECKLWILCKLVGNDRVWLPPAIENAYFVLPDHRLYVSIKQARAPSAKTIHDDKPWGELYRHVTKDAFKLIAESREEWGSVLQEIGRAGTAMQKTHTEIFKLSVDQLSTAASREKEKADQRMACHAEVLRIKNRNKLKTKNNEPVRNTNTSSPKTFEIAPEQQVFSADENKAPVPAPRTSKLPTENNLQPAVAITPLKSALKKTSLDSSRTTAQTLAIPPRRLSISSVSMRSGAASRRTSVAGSDEDESETRHHKYRTRCRDFRNCPYGTSCSWVHPTQKCPYFPRCSKGGACPYWHDDCKKYETCGVANCTREHHKNRRTTNWCSVGAFCTKQACPYVHINECTGPCPRERDRHCWRYHPPSTKPEQPQQPQQQQQPPRRQPAAALPNGNQQQQPALDHDDNRDSIPLPVASEPPAPTEIPKQEDAIDLLAVAAEADVQPQHPLQPSQPDPVSESSPERAQSPPPEYGDRETNRPPAPTSSLPMDSRPSCTPGLPFSRPPYQPYFDETLVTRPGAVDPAWYGARGGATMIRGAAVGPPHHVAMSQHLWRQEYAMHNPWPEPSSRHPYQQSYHSPYPRQYYDQYQPHLNRGYTYNAEPPYQQSARQRPPAPQYPYQPPPFAQAVPREETSEERTFRERKTASHD